MARDTSDLKQALRDLESMATEANPQLLSAFEKLRKTFNFTPRKLFQEISLEARREVVIAKTNF